MIRTLASIFITFGLIIGVSLYEIYYVQTTFQTFETALRALKDKTEHETVNYGDGLAIRELWDTKKMIMHVWIPHSPLQEIDYQIDEAIGYIYVQEYSSALPKIEVLIGLSENLPKSYTFHIGNIL